MGARQKLRRGPSSNSDRPPYVQETMRARTLSNTISESSPTRVSDVLAPSARSDVGATNAVATCGGFEAAIGNCAQATSWPASAHNVSCARTNLISSHCSPDGFADFIASSGKKRSILRPGAVSGSAETKPLAIGLPSSLMVQLAFNPSKLEKS